MRDEAGGASSPARLGTARAGAVAPRPGLDRGRLAWLGLGALALAGGTLLGWNGGLLDAIASPPAIVRAALVGGSALAGVWLLVGAVRRIEAGRAIPSASLGDRDLASLVRGVRLVFLAVAAFAAGAGWLVGHPLPFVIALVIAGVDVLETTFLLLVVTLRRDA
jgi:hypothetical protein